MLKNFVKYSLVILVVICFLWVGYCIWQVSNYNQAYSKINVGDSTDTVLKLLGQPKEIKDCGENIAWGSELSIRENNGECIKEWWYYSLIPILAPEMWTVGFDKQAKAISKYHYISP